MPQIYFRPHSWKKWQDDPDLAEQHYHIEAYGHNRESEPIFVRIDNFTPYALLELPDRNWTQDDAVAIHDYFKGRMGKNAPLKCVLTYRKRTYYYRGEKQYPLLQVSFDTEEGLRHIRNIVKYPVDIPLVGKMILTPREFDIGQIKKMLTLRGTTYIAWMTAEAEEIFPDDERYLGNDNGFAHEYLVSWRSLTPVPEEECSLWSVDPLVYSWDIEVYSANPKVFPNPLNIDDCSIMIGVTVQRLSDPSTRKQALIVYGRCDPIAGVDVRCFDTEIGMIRGWCAHIRETNADLMIGYNPLRFDYTYLNRRLMNCLEAWEPIGRVGKRRPEWKEVTWNSAAYGEQTLSYLEVDGRIPLDLYPLIQRDYKLRKYTLEFVSSYFLGEHKIPMDYEVMFRFFAIAHGWCFDKIRTAVEAGDARVLTDETDARYYFPLHTPEAIAEAVHAFETHRGTSAVGEAVLAVYEKYRGAVMAVVGAYGVQDTVLPINLLVKLNLWTNTGELATIVKVPIVDTFTRGQQIRVFSQFYDELVDEGYYVDPQPTSDLPFTGGYVHHPDATLNKYVLSFDFAGLYPSIIAAYNICYTTYVPDSATDVPDSMCNVIEWDEEGGEEAVVPEGEAEEDDEGEVRAVRTTKRHFRFRFIKKEIKEGCFPRFLNKILAKRKQTKKLMEQEKKGTMAYNILNARQAGLKVSANSGYGFLGVRKGKLPLLQAALCVTALGRKHIHEIMHLAKNYGANPGIQVYGDSVAEDTPVPIRVNGRVNYVRIDQVVDFSIDFDANRKEKQEIRCSGVEVWSDQGWTSIVRVIRHRVEKRMYRVVTDTGCVDVTEDHSLLRPNGEEVRPNQVTIGTPLMHRPLVKTESVDGPYDTTSKVSLAILFHQLQAQRMLVSGDNYALSFVEGEGDPTVIRQIIPLPHREQWVYDLETSNHHFAAGIGHLIVHNTDSAMLFFPNVPPQQIYEFGRRVAAELSLTLPKPMKLEFERAYYTFLTFTAKRYACVVLNEDGTPELDQDELYLKGIVLARRDNCALLTNLYRDLLICALYGKSFDEATDVLLSHLTLLMGRCLPRKDFAIVKGLAKSYKSESNVLFVYSQQLKAWGKPAQAGERLEYCFYETPEKLQGRKMVPLSMMVESPDKYRIDRLYYYEKTLIKPIQQLLSVAFHANPTLMKQIQKYLVMKGKLIAQIEEIGAKARRVEFKW